MYENVVVGVDFSPGGDAVLRSLGGLRAFGTRRLTLVHAILVSYPGPTTDFPAVMTTNVPTPDTARLEAARERLERSGFVVEIETNVGFAADVLVAAAKNNGASLILVGSRSHNRTTDAFVGSIAWDVVHRSPMPVLIQRIAPDDRAGAEPGMDVVDAGEFTRIVFATDWSDSSDRAFQEALGIAGTGAIRSFLVMHVRDEIAEARTGASARDKDNLALRELAERLKAVGATDVQVANPGGAAHTEILRAAAENPRTLIVIGTHGRGLAGEALLGSVSRQVVRHAGGAILLVPRGR